MVEERSSDSYKKPGFDARLKFTDELERWWIQIRVAQISSNFELWLSSLRGMYSFTLPFIQHKEKIKELMEEAYDEYNLYCKRGGGGLKNNVLNALYNWQDELFLVTKHLNLPMSGDEGEDFDIDEFMRRSQAR